MSDRFENDLRRVMDAGDEKVDDTTRQELARRRREALDQAARPALPLWKPVGAVAAALVAVVMLLPADGPTLPDMVVAETDDLDMDILLAEENLDLYEELEFYEWLSVVDDAG